MRRARPPIPAALDCLLSSRAHVFARLSADNAATQYTRINPIQSRRRIHQAAWPVIRRTPGCSLGIHARSVRRSCARDRACVAHDALNRAYHLEVPDSSALRDFHLLIERLSNAAAGSSVPRGTSVAQA